jgi:TolB protein
MKYLIVLALSFYLASCQTASDSPQETDNQSELKIAYNVFHDKEKDDYEVFIMDLDGKNQKNITNWEGVDWVDYAFKDKIYYISDLDTTHRLYYLHEMDASGKNVRKVSDIRLADSRYSSRKNGTEFIVRPHKSVDSAFYIINFLGALIQRVDPGLAYLSDPYFSPDGNQIVFRGSDKKFKKEEGFIDELYILNLANSELRQLTHYPTQDTTAEWYAYHAGPPVWLPDGRITYASKQEGVYSIFSTDSTGKEPVRLTPLDKNAVYHKWSPDGKLLVYEGSDVETGAYEIYLMNMETKEEKQLTRDTVSQFHPVFVEVSL